MILFGMILIFLLACAYLDDQKKINKLEQKIRVYEKITGKVIR